MSEQEILARAFQEIVKTRRSIRLFDKVPVPEEVVRTALDLALLAPNSSNLQPWEFVWVRSTSKKEQLVQACFSQAAASTAAELIVCIARIDTWRRNCEDMKIQLKELANQGVRIPKAATHYYDKLVPMVYSQGPLGFWGVIKKLFVFFLGLKKPISREPSSISDMKIWATKSTALACENLMLSLRASGYDSCPLEGIDSKRIRKLLGLPGQVLIPMVIAIGKRRSDGVTLPRIRADKSWFVREV